MYGYTESEFYNALYIKAENDVLIGQLLLPLVAVCTYMCACECAYVCACACVRVGKLKHLYSAL